MEDESTFTDADSWLLLLEKDERPYGDPKKLVTPLTAF